MALAPPPPLQIPATPIFPPLCLSTEVSVERIRAPEAPIGCPSDTAPTLYGFSNGTTTAFELSKGNYVANNTVKGNTDNYDFVSGNHLNLLLSEIPESIEVSIKDVQVVLGVVGG